MGAHLSHGYPSTGPYIPIVDTSCGAVLWLIFFRHNQLNVLRKEGENRTPEEALRRCEDPWSA